MFVNIILFIKKEKVVHISTSRTFLHFSGEGLLFSRVSHSDILSRLNHVDHWDMSEGLITAIASSHGPRYRALNAKQVPVIRAFDYIIPVLPDVHKHADNTQADLASSGRGGKKRQAGTREGRRFCVCRVSYLITGETSKLWSSGNTACGYVYVRSNILIASLFLD